MSNLIPSSSAARRPHLQSHWALHRDFTQIDSKFVLSCIIDGLTSFCSCVIGKEPLCILLLIGKAFISTIELFVFFWQAVSKILDKSLLNLPCSISEFCFPGYHVIVRSRLEQINFLEYPPGEAHLPFSLRLYFTKSFNFSQFEIHLKR